MSTTPHEPHRHSRLVTATLLGISGLGVLTLPFYWIVDSYAGEAIRGPVKKFVDEHFLLCVPSVALCLGVFLVCVTYLVTQWASSTACGPLRCAVRIACGILLLAMGVIVGIHIPFMWLLARSGSVRETVLGAESVVTTIAVGSMLVAPRRHRSWLVPLICGILVGELILLLQFAWDGWKVDFAL